MAQAVDSSTHAMPREPRPVPPSRRAALWGRFVNGEEDAATRLFERYLDRLTARWLAAAFRLVWRRG